MNSEMLTWASIAKSAIGPFVGAGLAFLSALLLQRRTRNREALAAGNLALLTLVGQLQDLLVYRRGVRVELARKNQGPHSPPWLLIHPVGFHFPESRSFDFQALTFLFDTPASAQVYMRLSLAEQSYFDLKARHQDMVGSALEVQKTLATRFRAGQDAAPLGELEELIGPELGARASDQLRAVLSRLDDEEIYTNAFADLRAAMVTRFDAKSVPQLKGMDEKFLGANLPPLPGSLA